MAEIETLTPQDCLVALMIVASASDGSVGTAELVQIGEIVDNLPIFRGYDPGRPPEIGRMTMELMEDEDGLDALFQVIRRFLPERLWETAYALACDVTAADGTITDTEARMLEEVRDELRLDRLHAAAIERGARARYQRL
jgi:tellurite resistance protein